MTYSRSPKSQHRILRKINLPDQLKTFFGKRGKFVRGLPSYEQIEGAFPENLDEFFDYTYGFGYPLKESHPINNNPREEYTTAQTRTKELLHLFFGTPSSEVSEPLREYMLTGGTKPIKISSHVSGQSKRVFAKLPSIERLVGLSLYNLISGNTPIDFLFSEYIFIEDAVPGKHIDITNIRYFQHLPLLPESVVRLAIQDRFIGLHDLDRSINMPGKPGELVNLLVQPDGKIVAFDVDCTFSEPFPKYDLPELLRQKGIHITKELEQRVSEDEARKIKQKINVTSRQVYENLINLIDKVPELIEQFKLIGHKSARKYFDEREKWINDIIKGNKKK